MLPFCKQFFSSSVLLNSSALLRLSTARHGTPAGRETAAVRIGKKRTAKRIRNLWNDGKFEPKIADFCDPRTSLCRGLFSSETGNLFVRRTIHWGLAGGIFGNGRKRKLTEAQCSPTPPPLASPSSMRTKPAHGHSSITKLRSAKALHSAWGVLGYWGAMEQLWNAFHNGSWTKPLRGMQRDAFSIATAKTILTVCYAAGLRISEAVLAINPAREVKMPEFTRTEGKTAGVQYRKTSRKCSRRSTRAMSSAIGIPAGTFLQASAFGLTRPMSSDLHECSCLTTVTSRAGSPLKRRAESALRS